ncbi:MAG TPA: glycosyltransferase family 39 protein [Solirubrobacteraceae bacterium]|nr:glycosyltransferase family 39 protein [Solirubrobacteraceae bacterium]
MLHERTALSAAEGASAGDPSPGGGTRRVLAAQRVAPLALAAIVAASFAAAAIWVRRIHDFSIMPDELGYVKQALHIARTGLPLTPHDFYFNSWSQLLPALLAPVFAAEGMIGGFYVAHTLEALMLASAAIPAYLLAGELRLGRAAQLLVAAATASVPWLVLSGLIMTENVGYPTFLWSVLALLRAIDRPSVRRDILALVSIALAFLARSQFAVLGPVLVACVCAHEVRLAAAGGRPALQALSVGLRNAVRRHPVLAGVSALAAAEVAALALTGSIGDLLGNYASVTSGTLLPAGTLSAAAEQLYGDALGAGLVPLALTAAWVACTLWAPRSPERHAFALLVTLSVASQAVLVGSFQQRFEFGGTTDRYLFYVVPLLFLGAAAWAVEARSSRIVTAAAGVAAALYALQEPFQTPPFATIIDPSFDFQPALSRVGTAVMRLLGAPGADPRLPLAVLVAAIVVTLAILRPRLPATALVAATMLPVIAFEMAETGYVMSRVGEVASAWTAAHPVTEGWIDRTVGPGADVGLLIATAGSQQNTWYTWWETAFWNQSVRRDFYLPGGETLSQGFVAPVFPDLADGRLIGLGSVRYLVKLAEDARIGLRARLVRDFGGLDLYRLQPGAPLTYATVDVQQDGTLVAQGDPLVDVFAQGPLPERERVTITLRVVSPERGCPCFLSTGSRRGVVPLPIGPAGTTATVSFSRTLTVASPRGATLPLLPRGPGGRPAAATVQLVAVSIRELAPRPRVS